MQTCFIKMLIKMKKTNCYTEDEVIELLELKWVQRGNFSYKDGCRKHSVRTIADIIGRSPATVSKQLSGEFKLQNEILDLVGMKWGIVDK